MIFGIIAGYSDTDSEWSSLERRQRAAETYSKVSRKSTTYKRARKKKTAIPVQPPRVPPLSGSIPVPPPTVPILANATDTTANGTSKSKCFKKFCYHILFVAGSGSNSDSSEFSEPEVASRHRFQKRPLSLKKPSPIPVALPYAPNTNFNIQLNSPELFSKYKKPKFLSIFEIFCCFR